MSIIQGPFNGKKQAPPPAAGGKQFNININLDDLPSLICDGCGGTIFDQASRFLMLSALISPSGKDELIVQSVAICVNCGRSFAYSPEMIMEKISQQALAAQDLA